MVIKNLENKVKLVTIICSLFLVGCVLISISSIIIKNQYVKYRGYKRFGQWRRGV